MTLAFDKTEKINDTYKKDYLGRKGKWDFNDPALNLQYEYGHTHIFNGNYALCSLDEISALIEGLEHLKACITYETGVIL